MNYLVACDDVFPDQPTGAGRVAWDIACAMRDRGHHVTHLSPDHRPGAPDDDTEIIDGITVVRFAPPAPRRLDLQRLGRLVAQARVTAGARLGDAHWDVLHMHSPVTGRGVLDALTDVTRVVYTMHSPIVLENRINWANQGFAGRVKMMLGLNALKRLERSVVRGSDVVHTLSQFTSTHLREFHGEHTPVEVIPHWRREDWRRTVDRAEARRKLGWPVDVPTLFTLRRHVHRMGLDTAIDAAAPLCKAGRCRLVIAGDGPLRISLTQRAREAGCDESQVDLPGRLSDDDLMLAYQAADLFLLPTRALECFGLIVVEAMAFGCPVLGTDVGAIPELLSPVTPNLIVPPGDADSMRLKLEAVLDGALELPDSELLERYVTDRFEKSKVLLQYLRLLERTDRAP